MAVLGKIRSKGALLVGIIGLGLFAFIAEEAFRSCESTRNQQRMQVGEVLGKKINVQEFQELIDEYTDVMKVSQGRETFSEEELNQIKDQVWNQYVQNSLIEEECKKIGLTVTDQEMANLMAEGTNPMLRQTPFLNQQTGRFDVNQLKRFLDEYKKIGTTQQQNPQVAEQMQTLYKYWTFMEKTLRQQLLAEKYQALVGSALLSNPVSAKAAFDAKSQSADIQLASLAYSTVNDNDVKISDSDLKAKYNEQKERFKQTVETRDIKYVDFQVVASPADREQLNKEMNDVATKLREGNDAAEVVRKSNSLMAYLGMPISAKALPRDVKAQIDSMSVGQTVGPKEVKSDNTLNVIKLIAKSQQPDSIQYRQIQVGGQTLDEARNRADSIYKALQSGADFSALAKVYGQEGKEQWLTSAMYENSNQPIEGDNLAYIKALAYGAENQYQNLEFATGNIIVQVLKKKAPVEKYDVAVVKRTIDFSKGTYSNAYNKFSQFVSEAGNSIKALEEKAAKYGFKVQERKDITSASHNVAGIRSTRDAMKWIFDAKKGEASPLYECGNNDHLLVVAVEDIHEKGYRSEKSVEEYLKSEVLKDKKYDMLVQKLNGVKTIEGAKAKGATVSDVNQISYSSPAYVQATGASEPALTGAVASTKQGEFHAQPVKGNAGVYVFKVTKKTNASSKFDEKAEEKTLQQQAMQAAGRFMGELYQKADIVDNRYLFF